jgi:calcineurin-like phosphoesterase family protein
MQHFFSSDHHFGHANILRYCAPTRPFASLEHMHEEYVARWNAVVGAQDVVWYLGDFSLHPAPMARFLPQLRGVKHLVVGNHDRCFNMQKAQAHAYLEAGFASVQRVHVLELEGLRLALSHFPYREQVSAGPPPRGVAQPVPRSAKANPASLAAGALGEDALAHGHVHQHWRARALPGRGVEINVGVDAWEGAPVGQAALREIWQQARAQLAQRPDGAQANAEGTWGPLPSAAEEGFGAARPADAF